MARAVTIPEQFDALRKRAGLSFDSLAKGMGYKSGSSIQRYLSEEYAEKRDFLPLEVVRKAIPVLRDKGAPPISEAEIMALAGIVEGTEPAAAPEIKELSGGQMKDDLIDTLVNMTISLGPQGAVVVIQRVWAELAKDGKLPRKTTGAETS